MNMRIAAVPSVLLHVPDPFQAEGELLLTGANLQSGAHRLVFRAASDIHQHLSPGQPAFAASIDVGVRDLTEPDVASHITVPRPQVGVDVRVVTMRRKWNPRRRAEVNSTGERPAGLVVEHGRAHPVSA